MEAKCLRQINEDIDALEKSLSSCTKEVKEQVINNYNLYLKIPLKALSDCNRKKSDIEEKLRSTMNWKTFCWLLIIIMVILIIVIICMKYGLRYNNLVTT